MRTGGFKRLDLYIHDYMLRKKFLTAAEIFAEEANVAAGPIVKEGPDCFLKEWWHVFWDKYSSGMPKDLEAMEGSSVQATQIMENEQLNHFPAVPNPGMNQQGGMQFQGDSGLDKRLPGQSEASLFAATMYEGEHGGLPAGELNSNQQLVGVDNLVRSDPSSSNASPFWSIAPTLQKPPSDMESTPDCGGRCDPMARWVLGNARVGNFQLQTHAGNEQWTAGDNYGAHMGGPSHVGSPVNGSPEANIPRAGPPDAGARNSANSVPLNGWPSTGMGRIPSGMEYPVLNSFVPVPNRQSQFQTLIPHHQQDISSQAMGNKNLKRISSFQGSTDSFGNQMFSRNGLGGTDGQHLSISFTTERGVNLAQMIMRRTTEQQTMVPNRPTLEQKMIIRNPMKQAVEQKMAGPAGVSSKHKQKNQHSQQKLREKRRKRKDSLKKDKVSNGTKVEVKKSSDDDIKSLFSPDNENADIVSTSFSDLETQAAACSLTKQNDLSIIGLPAPSKPLCKLLGHSGQVNSLDFHPDGDLLCSCDSNDEIKLWSIDQFACKHTFKGATRRVRFQPRCGTLLAAASGNGINLFDVETNTLQYSLEGHVKEVKSICWDTSGKYMASISEESARVWSIVYGGKCVQELQSNGNKFESCIFHPGYSNILVIGSNQSLELWNSIESNKTLTVPAHDGIVAVLADCTETEMIASASHESIKLWK
ncbi:hypothetical protein RHMOL_Rhmol13G0238300 [Rhododendron molle]|uniref:Uncharacterized protein n=1 Tax=Rhododendron molle TaxID=49168 RepID=A0ACC0LAJ6_RHOML|nr:hypothetical protein RHMOL_Rhmol13G0238300 [Rhododendron molle]